jgi:hypothetical protein
MSVAFLSCADFKSILPADHVCCESCHKPAIEGSLIQPGLICVRAYQEDVYGKVGNCDYQLCVEAQVCCKSYDIVRALPRQWWLDKANELGVSRGDGRGYVYPSQPERNTERTERKYAAPTKVSKAKVKTSVNALAKILGAGDDDGPAYLR